MMGSDIAALITRAMKRVCDCGHTGAQHDWGGICTVLIKEAKGEPFCGCDNYAMPGNLPALIRQLELEEKEPPLNAKELRTLPQAFEDMASGARTFLAVGNERGFAVGDLMRLRERRPGVDEYTGREHIVRVVYRLDEMNGLMDGYCILGIAPPDEPFKDGGRTRFPERGDFKDRVEHHHPEGISRKSIDSETVTVENLPIEWVMETARKFASDHLKEGQLAPFGKVVIACRQALRRAGLE